jgi:hypothetical protein
MRSAVFLLLGLAWGVPRVAKAQAQLQFAPYVGLYWPTSILASGGGEILKQQSSVTLGMRVTRWWPGRLGVEGTVGYAPSPLWSSQYGLTFRAHVLTISAKAFVRVTSPGAWAALHVGGGVGLVGHGGDAYRPWYVGPRTFVGGVANARVDMKLARSVALQLDAEDFIYSARIGPCTRTRGGGDGVCDLWNATLPTGGPTGSTLQHDVVLSLGFALVELY